MDLSHFIRKHRGELASACDDPEPHQLPSEHAIAAKRRHIAGVLDRIAERIAADDLSPGALRDLAMAEASLRYHEGVGLADFVAQYTRLRSTFLAMYAREQMSQPNEWRSELAFVNGCLDEAISASTERFATETTRDRDILLAAVGHDLGNEIAVVRIAAARMLNEVPITQSVSDKAVIVSNSVQLMARMVSDLGDFAQVQHCGSLSVQRQPCDASSVCRSVVAGALLGRAGRDVSVSSSGPSKGCWDPDRLAQLVRNLVSNALEHGRGQVVVTVGPANDAAWIRIAVRNHGPVIPFDTRPKLFEPMCGHASRARHGRQRLRLGLFMVKTIAQAHGGRVCFESSADEGTTFVVSLPLDGGDPLGSATVTAERHAPFDQGPPMASL